jgi:hypothetical protein
MAESVEMQVAAREQWKVAAALNAMCDNTPPLYGLHEDAVEKNTVKGVVEYCRRTMMDLVEHREVLLTAPVDLHSLDVDWKGDK